MFFHRQFEKFNPVSGYVPDHPFSYLPEIAYRARALLRNRTAEQIEAAAKRINSEVDGYFSDLKEVEISRLQSEFEGGDGTFEKFFEWDGGTRANGYWIFKEEMEEELDILTAENSSEVDALKTIIENRDSCFFLPEGAPEPEREEWPEGTRHELFATLSLWMLADALEFANNTQSGISISGEYAIKAMDAVCYAEHLREADWLESYIKKNANVELAEALKKQKNEQQEWIRYCEKIRKERVLAERSNRAKELNTLRHSETHKAKKLVIGEWNKNRNQFPSGEQAGLHYADWLETQGVFHKHSKENNSYEWYTPRTATKWIRDYAKEIGFLFRP